MSLPGDLIYWITILGVLVVNASLVYVAWWALFSDRARGRRRCPRCWYDMAYSPGMTCAECGYIARREKQFYRTRRRYKIAAAAILGGVLIAVLVNERVAQRGFYSLLPNRVLLWLTPLSDGSRGSALGELSRRAARGDFDDAQWTTVIEHFAAGDFRATPVTDEWVAKYGGFITNYRRGFDSEHEAAKPLLALPPRIELAVPPAWPAEVPFTLGVQVRDWWPVRMECRLTATLLVDGQPGSPHVFYRSGDERVPAAPYPLALGVLPPDGAKLELDVQVDRRPTPQALSRQAPAPQPPAPQAPAPQAPAPQRTADDAPASVKSWEPVARQTFALNVQPLPAAQLPQPLSSEDAIAAMMSVFNQGVVGWTRGRSPVRFRLNILGSVLPALDNTAVGVSVDLMCDDVIARRLNLWWLAGTVSPSASGSAAASSAQSAAQPLGRTGADFDRRYGYEVAIENPDLLSQLSAADSRWTFRVRSDRTLALRAGPAQWFWEGEFTVPMTVRTFTGRAPSRAWWSDSEPGPAKLSDEAAED